MCRKNSEYWMHPHPAAIVLYSLRQALLLLIPIVRALFSSQHDFTDWNHYVWVDLLAVFAMFGIGFLRYHATKFRLEGQGLLLQTGMLIRRRGYIPFSELSVMACEKNIFFAPIRYCVVYLDTDAGKTKHADFKIALSYRQYRQLRKELSSVVVDCHAARRISRSRWWETLLLSLIASDSLSGILFVSAAISGFGDFFSIDLRELIQANFEYLYRFANKLAIKIPPAAAWIGYILMITWGVSFLVHAVKNMRFTVVRQGNAMGIISGLFSRFDHWLHLDRINRIDIRQSFLTRLLQIQSVFVRSCGYGKQKYNLAVLIPAGTNRRAEGQLSLLLPEYQLTSNQIRPPLRFLRRFANAPLMSICAEILLFWYLIRLMPDLRDTLLFLGAAVLIPTVWYLVIRIGSWFHVGAGRTGDMLTFRYLKGFRFMTSLVHFDKISGCTLRQSLFQQRKGGCDLLIYTRDEARRHFRIPNLSLAEAEEFMQAALREG